MSGRSTFAVAALTLILVVAGCSADASSRAPSASSAAELGVDLVPVPLPGIEGFSAFCDLDHGSLQVTVGNLGGADAAATAVTVAFDYTSKIGSARASAIPARSATTVQIELPSPVTPNAFDFTITVDADGDLAEANEANNYGEGQCPAEPR